MKRVFVLTMAVILSLLLLSSCGVKVDENVKETLELFFDGIDDGDSDAIKAVLSEDCPNRRAPCQYLMELEEEDEIYLIRHIDKVTVTYYEKKTCVGYTEYLVEGKVESDFDETEFKIELIGDDEGTKITSFSFK